MTGFVRSIDRCRLTAPQHAAVLAVVRWYLDNPCLADGVEIDRLRKVEIRMARQPTTRNQGSFVRQSDNCRLSLRQHRSLVAICRWAITGRNHERILGVDLERVRKATKKLEEVLRVSEQFARPTKVGRNTRPEHRPESYWRKRIADARFRKQQVNGGTIWKGGIA